MKPELGKYPKPLFERTWHDEPYIWENLLINRQSDLEKGKTPSCLTTCFNVYGQAVASEKVKKTYPAEIKLLEDIFNTEKAVSNAFRSGDIINGKAAIVLTYDIPNKHMVEAGISDPYILHAQIRMMAEQLNEALLSHGVNICSSFLSSSSVAGEIHAIIPADRDREKRVAFEKEFDALIDRLALSKDISWVKKQYDAFVNELNENINPDWRPNLALKNGCTVSDIAIEACSFLGQKIGGRHFMFDKARFSHDMEKAQKLAENVDVTKNQGFLDSCLYNGAIRAEYIGAKKITLHTKSPLDSLYSPSIDSFQVSKNELRSIMNEMGYDKDLSVIAFLNSYSYEAAEEIKSVFEDRHKKPLSERLNEAEKKRSITEPKTPVQKKEQDYDL